MTTERQVDPEGAFLHESSGPHQPNDLAFPPNDRADICESEDRLDVRSRAEVLLDRWGNEGEGSGAGQFISPHGFAIDSQDSLSCGDITDIDRGIDGGSRNLQKLAPQPAGVAQ